MFALILSLVFALQAYAIRGAPTIDEEREVLEKMSSDFAELGRSVAAADAEFVSLRRAARAGEATKWDSNRISKLITESTRQWNALERQYTRARAEGLDLHRLTYRQNTEFTPDFSTYLSFYRNQRFGSGVPMPLLLVAWRGLLVGEKLAEPPGRMRDETEIAGVKIDTADSVLLMTVHGGLIRGRFVGTYGDSLILREVLPGPLSYVQRSRWYRRLTFEEIARMEVIPLPEGIKLQATPQPVIDSEGDYAPYYAKQVFKIDFQPDDLELLAMVEEGVKTGYRHAPRAIEVDRRRIVRPDYAGVFFADCSTLLRKR